MKLPPLPNNIGKRRIIKDINGDNQHLEILDEIRFHQSNFHEKAIYLQKIEFLDVHRIEFRLGYYIIGKKPRSAGKWVWGQFATMLPVEDFSKVVHLARERGWF